MNLSLVLETWNIQWKDCDYSRLLPRLQFQNHKRSKYKAFYLFPFGQTWCSCTDHIPTPNIIRFITRLDVIAT